MTLEQRISDLASAIGADVKSLQTAIASLGGGGNGAGVPVYVQQTDPAVASPYIWFKTDGDGNVVDILKG